MRLLIIGAGGDAGSRIQAEAHRRGHDVTPASRRPRVSSWMRIDAADPDRVEAACREHDVLIASTRPGAGREGEVVDVARGLARGAGRAATPLLVVGGASPLRIAGTAHSALEDPRFVPEHIRPIARASTRQLEVLQEYPDTDWTYLAPAAHFAPGPRTARYRITDGELVIGADGRSAISMEDFAVATLDLAESGTRAPRAVVGIG